MLLPRMSCHSTVRYHRSNIHICQYVHRFGIVVHVFFGRAVSAKATRNVILITDNRTRLIPGYPLYYAPLVFRWQFR